MVRAGFRLAHGDPEPALAAAGARRRHRRDPAELGYDAGAIAALRGDQAI